MQLILPISEIKKCIFTNKFRKCNKNSNLSFKFHAMNEGNAAYILATRQNDWLVYLISGYTFAPLMLLIGKNINFTSVLQTIIYHNQY